MLQDTSAPAGPSPALVQEILDAFDRLFGLHPGFRPVHAKGAFCKGAFTPAPAAAALTRAPHASRPSTPVLVRFSNSTGVPIIPDNDPNASPRGFAVRFILGDHVHTDIIGHSTDGFPTRTGEDFVKLLTAIAASGPDVPHPNPIESFLGAHPSALAFVQAPKPFPTSFAHESFFAITAFKFSNHNGQSQFGRFRILPEAGNQYLDAAQAAARSPDYLFDELGHRLASGPIKFRITVQLPAPGDDVNDASVTWPATRPEHDFGTISLTERADDADPELRKIIFDPMPRVDGIDPSDDPLIAVRSAVYLFSGRRRRAAAAH
jgi:catalase